MTHSDAVEYADGEVERLKKLCVYQAETGDPEGVFIGDRYESWRDAWEHFYYEARNMT